MSTLREYLTHKRHALDARRAAASKPNALQAKVSVEGRSGVRRIKIRDFQVISDSALDFAGYDLGPTSPELQMGALASCLAHMFLMCAAASNVPLDALEVEVSAKTDPRGGQQGYEHIPVHPHDVNYAVRIESPASEVELIALHQAVERSCPILNLLANPQKITGRLVHTPSSV